MRIRVSQLNYHIGNFEGNLAKILMAIAEARSQQVDLICFSELAVCGYPPRDFLEFNDFIKKGLDCIEAIKQASDGIGVVVGAPTPNPRIEGKDLFNSAYFIADQRVVYIQHKALLPTYDIFDEYRYFEPASEFKVVEYKGLKIALTVCEDIWNIGNENPLYTTCPMDQLINQDPDFMINLSASPFNYSQAEERIDIIRANVLRYELPMFYINHVGAQTEIIFDGGSVVMKANGKIYEELPYFEECHRTYELDDVLNGQHHRVQPKHKIKEIHDALVLGVRDYFHKLGFTKCLLGLSGGIDSAVTAVIAQKALGKDNVHALLMPSQYSSDHSVNDAVELSKILGIRFDIIKIEDIYHSFMGELAPLFGNLPFNLAEENIQLELEVYC